MLWKDQFKTGAGSVVFQMTALHDLCLFPVEAAKCAHLRNLETEFSSA